jgi:hypothetical protein
MLLSAGWDNTVQVLGCICKYAYVCVYTYMYIRIYIHTYMYIHMCLYVYICVCACVIYTCVCIYTLSVCTYIHTYIYYISIYMVPRYGTRGQMCHRGAFLEHISRGIRWISGAILLSPVRGGLKNSSR